MDDPHSPSFLHHKDSPGLVSVSQFLTGDNYHSWNCAMAMALSVKNKHGFIDGSFSCPSADYPALLQAWTRNNHIVMSWILNSFSKEIGSSIIYCQTAQEIWNDLKDRFQ